MEYQYACYTCPISHTVRILGSFAILFEYRTNWKNKEPDVFIKEPVQSVVVDNFLQDTGEDVAHAKNGEELFDYLLYVYDNFSRFHELFNTEKYEYVEFEDKIAIMEQIVLILNKRFSRE